MAELRDAVQAIASVAGKRGVLVLAVAAVTVLAVVGLSLRSRTGPGQGQLQPSTLRQVAQRVATAPPSPKLVIDAVRQNGHVVELTGRTECSAALMINGDRVPLIFDNCGFKHFLLLPEGTSTIAVTAQGTAGGVNTQLIKVNIE